ncbi:MAG: DUF2254 domain-containing protein [Deltaproteobacteria bacterium]|nr:DUF2254 domain-containing protein [Deltaproteobacteria bacterium]
MNKLTQLWNKLCESFWFVPSMIVAGSIVLAAALIEAHSTEASQWLARWPRLFGANANGARGILSTIAGSMMTVVGVTFSMTLVALALASSQYTSRILRNFIRNRVTQVVLGVFTGIFAYCLVVLRTIRSGDEGGFVPSLAVFVAVILAMVGIGVLIFFIHHISASIQASNIIASVADETLVAIDRLFPERLGQCPPEGDEDQLLPTLLELQWQTVKARRNGYIQSVDNETLLRLAREKKTILRMERGVGDFIVQNTALASVASKVPLDKKTIATVQAAYSIERYRTVHQDCAFGIRQIVDMALRALSPSINDTTKAVMCVDYLTAILARLASRDSPSMHRYEEKELRIIAIAPTFTSLVAESFDQIRGSAQGNTGMILRILGALHTIASLTVSPSRRQVLREQMQLIDELAERTVVCAHERAKIDKRLVSVCQAIEAGPALCTEDKKAS